MSTFGKGDRVRHTEYGYTGTVEEHLGGQNYLVHADRVVGGYTPLEITGDNLEPLAFEDIPIAGETRETRSVLRYLSTEVRMHHTLADDLRTDSVEQFKQDAIRSLGDATEIAGSDLRGADWVTVFNTVKEERGE